MEYRVQVKVVDWDLGWIDVLVARECECTYLYLYMYIHVTPCYPGVHTCTYMYGKQTPII